MCLHEPETSPGLRGEARLKGLPKVQERNKVINTFILLFIDLTISKPNEFKYTKYGNCTTKGSYNDTIHKENSFLNQT